MPQSNQVGRKMAYYSLILFFGINMVNYLDRYLVSGALKSISDSLDLNHTQAGALVPAFMIVYMIIAPLFGWLGDRYSRKWLIAIGVGLWSIATSGAYFVTTYAQLFFTRVLVGVGEAAYATIAPTIISDLFSTKSRGRSLSFFYMAIPIGSALGLMLGGWISFHYSWRVAFLTMGIPGLMLAGLMLTTKEPQRGASEGQNVKSNVSLPEAYGELWKTPSFVYVTLGMAAMTFAMGGMAHWMPYFLQSCHGMAEDKAGLVFGGITVVAGFLGTFVGGWLGDWYQQRQRGAYFIVCGIGMIIGAPLTLTTLWADSFTLLWPAIFMAEFFLFLNTGPGNAIIANVSSPAIRSTAFAVNLFFIHLLGDAVSPTIIGGFSDLLHKFGMAQSSSLNLSMYIMPIMMVISGILFLLGTPYLAKDVERINLAQIR